MTNWREKPGETKQLGDLNPQRLTQNELVTALRTATNGGRAELRALRPGQFARLIALSSAEQIEALMTVPALREVILDETFRRMDEHYRGKTSDVVVHWQLGNTESDYLRYECVLAGNSCVTGKEFQRKPDVIITLTPTDFLRLISGNASPFGLFMTGKLLTAGDFGFAVRLNKLFRLPKPDQSGARLSGDTP